MLNRKKFLKISAGTAASFVITSYLSPVLAKENFFDPSQKTIDDMPRQLLVMEAHPPEGTKAVRFFIDDMQVAELTTLYADKTKTKPIWKTLTDPGWLDEGEHELRIEADTEKGTQVIDTKKIKGTNKNNTTQKICLTGEWEFAEMTDLPEGALDGKLPPASQPGYSRGKWTKIFVPNSLGAVKEKWNVWEGILGIYRRRINMPVVDKSEQAFIVLKSCYWSGHVFINGIEVGDTKGGYLPSRFDITRAIKQGTNEITVIVDNRFSTMGVFKRINEFYWNWGGLLQEVHIEKHPLISFADLRAEGTMSGALQLHLTGLNATSSAQNKNVTVEIYNAANHKVAGAQVLVTLPAGENIIRLKEIKIGSPVLWNLEKPYLYTIIVKGEFGTLKERTGFRTIKVSGRDILLNGQIVQNLQGFDRHADYPGLGRTQPGALPYQELKQLRDKGYRFFRPAHYPTTPEQLDAADELGLLVIEEINVTGLKGAQLASQEVKDFGAQQLTKMIYRDRSHPCIMAWSVGNENLTEEEGAEEYVRDTISIGRSLDATRLFTQVTHRHTTDKTFRYQDLVCQNYYAGWYAKDVNVIGNLLDTVQAYAGNKPIILSEYGAEAVIARHGTVKSTEFYQGFVVDAHNRILNNKKHFFGKMYWCSTEFWCRPTWTGGSPDPIPPFHVKSLISLDRKYKKLGWRVMFSPVRLLFNPHTVKGNDLGGDVEIAADKMVTITQVITVKEIKGQSVKGNLILDLPKGFESKIIKYPFELKPEENQSITLTLTGMLTSPDKSADCFIKAIIDEDTEAQPLLLTIKVVGT